VAEKQQSNKLLEKAIETCLQILSVPDVPKKLLIVASKFCVGRQSFRGQVINIVEVLTLNIAAV